EIRRQRRRWRAAQERSCDGHRLRTAARGLTLKMSQRFGDHELFGGEVASERQLSEMSLLAPWRELPLERLRKDLAYPLRQLVVTRQFSCGLCGAHYFRLETRVGDREQRLHDFAITLAAQIRDAVFGHDDVA